MLLELLLMSLGDSDLGPERIIARCAATSVRYGDIAISLNIVTRLARLSKGPKASGLSDEEIRHAVEQERLDRIIASLALRFAEHRFNMQISQEEVMASLPARARDEAAYRRSF